MIIKAPLLMLPKIKATRGGSKIFLRGGGADFQKIFENFVDPFF